MLSTTDVAKQLGVDPSTVRRWIYSGKLVASQLGGHSWMVQEGDLEGFAPPKRGRPPKEDPGYFGPEPEDFT